MPLFKPGFPSPPRLLYPAIHLLPWPSDDPDQPNKYFLLFYGCTYGQVYSLDEANNLVGCWGSWQLWSLWLFH